MMIDDKDIVKVFKWTVTFLLMSVSVVLLFTSFYAYVILPHRLTRADIRELLEAVRDVPLDLLTITAVASFVRCRMWQKGSVMPYGVKAALVLLSAASVLSWVVVSVYYEKILNLLPPTPFWLIWLVKSIILFPLLFTWLIFPSPDADKKG